MNGTSGSCPLPCQVPIFPMGKEPLPPGLLEEDRPMFQQQKKWERYTQMAMESCVAKTAISGSLGFGMGAAISLMSQSFAYEDPMMRAQQQAGMKTAQKAGALFKEMGKAMYTSGRGFGKIGALFSGIECVIESYRAKNDIWNSLSSGFLAGGVLARNSGPKAAFGGGLAFAAFSGLIDLVFLRRETPEED